MDAKLLLLFQECYFIRCIFVPFNNYQSLLLKNPDLPNKSNMSRPDPKPRKKGGSSGSGQSGKVASMHQGDHKKSPRPPLTGESGLKPLEERRGRSNGHGKGKPGIKNQRQDHKQTGERVRLNKYIAAAGICSRREADDLISAGLISVNGKTVTQLGSKVDPGDEVKYNGERIRSERKVYLLLNKPKDYVTTTDDPRERKTVMLLIRDACSERVYPVGRLDRNTTGVLLFTNDGDLAKKMTHPSSNKKKIYHVFLDRNLTAGDLKKLAEGVTLEDGFIQPDAISYASSENKKEVGLEIHSGKNRIVRRMFESVGYRVNKLDRVYFGGLTKKNLPRGKWRFLTDKEISMLKMNAYE
jgi:23S rRNA pseudouridine2605 synthase